MTVEVESLIADPSLLEDSSGDVVTRDVQPDELSASGISPGLQIDDLAQIIQTYNDVTEKLQRSHDVLGREVIRLQEEGEALPPGARV